MEDLQGGTLALEHRYDVERRDGKYALVSMYSGTQHPFERPIKVKLCDAPHTNGAPDVYERLKKSIVRAAAFEHPKVPKLSDFGDFDANLAFWVVEHFDAVALDEHVERHGTLPPTEAVRIACEVADVVAAAHATGLIHGGIAPRWIGIAKDGVVTMEHFGIQPTMADLRSMPDVLLTRDVIWSTPPEAFADDVVEHSEAGDVWALGALLYWMVTGVHPYLDDPTDTADAVLRLRAKVQPPSLEELGFDIALAAFVDRALAVEVEDRFPSVRAFLDAAPRKVDVVADEPTPLPTITPVAKTDEPVRTMGTAFAIAIVVLVLSNLAWFFYTTMIEPEPAHVEATSTAGPAILPVGATLNTIPAGARVFRIDEGAEIEFGDVPLTLDPKALPGGELPLIVRKAGHQDVRLDVVADEDGHTLTVHLAELP